MDILKDVPSPDSTVFEQSPITMDEFDTYRELAGRLTRVRLHKLSTADERLLLTLALRFTPGRHTIVGLSHILEGLLLQGRALQNGVELDHGELFTCIAEETFFRSLIQEKLHRLCTARPWARPLPILLPALLFGAVHLSGGLLYASLAGLAGLGYALIYARTRRIEAAVIAHFSVNLVHFTGFTYPGLAH